MTDRSKWIARIIEISERLPNVCPDLCTAYGYAELGYDAPDSGIVVLANWNPVRFDSKDKSDNTMPRLAKVLEHFGASIEWIDEWAICECGKCVRTVPDSHGWTSSFYITRGDLLCRECILDDLTDYLEYLRGNVKAALTPSLNIDLTEHDYNKYCSDCRTGFHYGDNDSPKEIAESLRRMGIENFIFEIDDAQQFTVIWSVWVHRDELRRLKSYERKQRIAA